MTRRLDTGNETRGNETTTPLVTLPRLTRHPPLSKWDSEDVHRQYTCPSDTDVCRLLTPSDN